MIWIDDIKARYLAGEVYADISYNLDTVVLDSSLDDTEVEACCLTSAVITGNYGLWNYIYDNYSTEIQHKQAALAAAQAMTAYSQHEFIKVTVAVSYAQSRVRNRALTEFGTVPIHQYDLYRLAAALTEQNTDIASQIGKQCLNNGYTNLQLADVNRIVTMIKILGKILPDSLK